ncbi:mucin-21-like [Cydia pomonella]|uniref:mucin-21-like n=1 Tax=Cydia pomonella TaxID=82600 RepID=UPI002ADD7885|nr:mucin-21-like [Cydia pomonella]
MALKILLNVAISICILGSVTAQILNGVKASNPTTPIVEGSTLPSSSSASTIDEGSKSTITSSETTGEGLYSTIDDSTSSTLGGSDFTTMSSLLTSDDGSKSTTPSSAATTATNAIITSAGYIPIIKPNVTPTTEGSSSTTKAVTMQGPKPDYKTRYSDYYKGIKPDHNTRHRYEGINPNYKTRYSDYNDGIKNKCKTQYRDREHHEGINYKTKYRRHRLCHYQSS